MGRILERLESEYIPELKKKRDEEKIILIPAKSLKLSKSRARKSMNRDDISLMASSIKTFGILQPLEINEKNEVILGNRRFEAARLASLEKVPCIRRQSSEIYELEKQLVSDIHSKHLSVLDRAFAFKKIIELKGITKYSLAKYLNLSHSLVCRTMAILEANTNTLNLIKKKKISELMAATVLYRLKDNSLEDFAINEIIEKKMSIIQAGNFIAELNDPELFKKHFLAKIRGFKTSLQNFKEKLNLIKIDENIKREIEKEMESIRLNL